MKTPSSIAIAALCLSLALPVSAACPSMIFTTAQTRTDGAWTIFDLETLDYDDDGKLDVVGLMQGNNGGPATLYA